MKTRGFTLLEILVVLAILGMGMALITEMTSVAARHSERVEEDTIVQLACENMMNSILAGNMTATIGISTPIPDAPNWETTIELLDGPIANLIAIRITAQRYQVDEVPSIDNPSVSITTRIADPGRRFVIKEWARRAEIKTRVVQTSATGETTATDGAGETVWQDLGGPGELLGGGLGGSAPVDPFAEIDRATNAIPNFSAPAGMNVPDSSGLGGGLGGNLGGGF
jgi:prepilin-type N-terminal cleavage/methylation domain-containing protein